MFWDNCDLPNIDVRGLPLNMFWGAVYGVKAPRGYARLRGATSFIRAHLPGSRLGRDLEAKTGNKMVISSNFSKAPLEWCRWMWTASWRWWEHFFLGQNGDGKGKGSGGGKSSPKFDGNGDNCGKYGHRKKDCWSKDKSGGKGGSSSRSTSNILAVLEAARRAATKMQAAMQNPDKGAVQENERLVSKRAKTEWWSNQQPKKYCHQWV